MNALKTTHRIWRNSGWVILFLTLHQPIFSQSSGDQVRILFYNVENLFDTVDDSITLDEEFLPVGKRHWTPGRYYQKMNRIAKVIFASGEGNLPVVIGLCEIENRRVLDHLLEYTPLKNMGYRIVHKESPDPRGIDVALLYRSGLFRPVTYRAIPVINPADPAFATRDILYVKGIVQSDTLHFFVNHWPSKYGGELPTLSLRVLAASALRRFTDSLFVFNPNSKIIIMGDFNDSPFDKSVSEVLGAKAPGDTDSGSRLINLAYPLAEKGLGTLKYQGRWEMIDQIIVSVGLLQLNGVHVNPSGFQVFSPSFLQEKDGAFLGYKPKRTYLGFRYNDGFSDHFPVMLDLLLPDE